MNSPRILLGVLALFSLGVHVSFAKGQPEPIFGEREVKDEQPEEEYFSEGNNISNAEGIDKAQDT